MPRPRRKVTQKRTPSSLPKSRQKKVVPQTPRSFRGFVFIAIGLFLISLPLLASRQLPQLSLTDSFSSEPVKVDPILTQSETKATPNRIIIPEVGIDLPVKLSPVQNGYWVVYPDSAGFGDGSASPGEGNTVIFAHARKGLFLPLKQAKNGQRIYVFTPDRYFIYEIKEIKEILPNQIEVISPTPDSLLTLYTCSGFLDRKRLIVVAAPV